MKKSLVLAIALATSVAGFQTVFAAQSHGNHYNTVATVDSKGNSTYLHPSATWDGAYFPKNGDPAQYGNAVGSPYLTKVKTTNGITEWNVNGGGKVYSTNVNGHEVFNYNSFSSDTMPNGKTIPAMILPSNYNVNISRLQQLYQMDYAATMRGFEAEERIEADNKLHNDDVKAIGTSIDAKGNIKTELTYFDGSKISDTVGIGDYVKNNAGDAYYGGSSTTTINQAISNNTSAINYVSGKLLGSITSSVNGNKTTYTYKAADGETIFGKTYDVDTKLISVGMIFSDDEDNSVLSWNGVNNDGSTLGARVEGIASRKYVDDKVKEINNTIGGLTDTNTKNASISASLAGNTDGDLTISVTDTDGNTVSTTVSGIASKGDIAEVRTIIGDVSDKVDNIDNRVTNNTNNINNIKNDITNINSSITDIKGDITNINNRLDNLVDNDTITTITTGDDWLANEVTETEDGFDNKLTFNEDKLRDFIGENTSDTITTVSGKGLAQVTETKTDSGLHYEVDVDVDQVKEIAKSVDTNTTNVAMDTVRDSEAGTATISVKDSDDNVVSTTIEDVASHKELKDYKEYNEIDKSVMREVINNNTERIGSLENRVSELDSNIKETGAMAAALAGLHPRMTDGNKGEWMMSLGHYKGKTAVATGLAYAPDQHVMFTTGISAVGGGDYMFNIGATFALDRRQTDPKRDIKLTRREVDQIVEDVKAENAELKLRLARIEAALANK